MKTYLDSLDTLNGFLYSTILTTKDYREGRRLLEEGHDAAEKVFWARSAHALQDLSVVAGLAEQFMVSVTNMKPSNITGESNDNQA